MSRRFRIRDGRQRTALELQRALAEGLADHAQALPAWAPRALALWFEALDDLEALRRDADRLPTVVPRQRFDWTLYVDLLRELAQEQASALGPDEARLRAAGHELYIRLHILGKHSLFETLGRDGALDHTLPEVTADRIADAVNRPPAGRAAQRASLIARASEIPGAMLSWDALFDRQQIRWLRIPEVPTPGWEAAWDGGPHADDTRTNYGRGRAFRRGYYASFLNGILESRAVPIARLSDTDPPSPGQRYARLPNATLNVVCLSHARTGQPREARAAWECYRSREGVTRFDALCLEIFSRVEQGLVAPAPSLWPLVEQAEELLAQTPQPSDQEVILRQCKGRLLLAQGRNAQAVALLETVVREEAAQASRPRMLARSRCLLGEALRRCGDVDRAKAECRAAMAAQERESLRGDLAVHGLPLQARLASSDGEAADALRLAEALAWTTRNPLTLARVLCLKARRLKTSENREVLSKMLASERSLVACPVAARVRREWELWTQGPGTAGPEDYWGIL